MNNIYKHLIFNYQINYYKLQLYLNIFIFFIYVCFGSFGVWIYTISPTSHSNFASHLVAYGIPDGKNLFRRKAEFTVSDFNLSLSILLVIWINCIFHIIYMIRIVIWGTFINGNKIRWFHFAFTHTLLCLNTSIGIGVSDVYFVIMIIISQLSVASLGSTLETLGIIKNIYKIKKGDKYFSISLGIKFASLLINFTPVILFAIHTNISDNTPKVYTGATSLFIIFFFLGNLNAGLFYDKLYIWDDFRWVECCYLVIDTCINIILFFVPLMYMRTIVEKYNISESYNIDWNILIYVFAYGFSLSFLILFILLFIPNGQINNVPEINGIMHANIENNRMNHIPVRNSDTSIAVISPNIN